MRVRSEAKEPRRQSLPAAVTDRPQQGRGAVVPSGTALTSFHLLPSTLFQHHLFRYSSLPSLHQYLQLRPLYSTFTSLQDAPVCPASTTHTSIPSLGRRTARPSLHARSPPTQTSGKWRVNIVTASCMSSWHDTVGGERWHKISDSCPPCLVSTQRVMYFKDKK